MTIIGYDLDGIIAAEGPHFDLLFRVWPALAVRWRDSRLNPLLARPVCNDGVIVTGRPEQDKHSTERWLSRRGIHLPVLLTKYEEPIGLLDRGGLLSFTAAAKSRMCAHYSFEYFVESDVTTRRLMRLDPATGSTKVLDFEEAVARGLLAAVK